VGFNFEIVKINPAENDSCVRWRRDKPGAAANGGVETYPIGYNCVLYSELVRHAT
jgi:hypothetical protein